ncbi:uncharacterized protein ATNIH1004_001147 [Aspergillus tanneri]|uniref:Uncharacterized protein n=1 Tax=Aspergillus tanneri TaxID=1220188 RepID=A0A5M9N4S7_9EURO|nr:uncharacterized protein ATNIH1004_001147 [Aspergillus tanneri]KAA8652243.1 hypothetical protein ATNIH1004_001147 [Aspergillus tanneri]
MAPIRTPLADHQAILHAYRHLYRQGLKVVNYSTPSRHVLLHTLRSSFRSGSPQDFDPQKIANTLRFLQRARDVAGMEHKIVKNILIARYWEQPILNKEFRILYGLGINQKEASLRESANEQFNLTLMLLNESLGTCLR